MDRAFKDTYNHKKTIGIEDKSIGEKQELKKKIFVVKARME
jgi:hypothetical protein